jgi:hypothetical protein
MIEHVTYVADNVKGSYKQLLLVAVDWLALLLCIWVPGLILGVEAVSPGRGFRVFLSPSRHMLVDYIK